MKVLLDEMLPVGLRDLLPQHDVATAVYAGLAGVSNGEMLRTAASAGFKVVITLDRSQPGTLVQVPAGPGRSSGHDTG